MKADKKTLTLGTKKKSKKMNTRIKPTINAKGFRTAVKDYNESSIVEELAANSYDANASTVLVLLDTSQNKLYIIDDGEGFNKESIKEAATLGGGNKNAYYKESKRVFLGSYGVGLKATVNIAKKLEINSCSDEDIFETIINWEMLEQVMTPESEGYPVKQLPKEDGMGTGTTIVLELSSMTNKSNLDEYGKGLANLPTDNGSFKCYFGFYTDVSKEIKPCLTNYKGLKKVAQELLDKQKITLASDTVKKELEDCDQIELTDSIHKDASAKFYFSGMQGIAVKPLKSSLRGIYVRVHDRLLKHDFSEDKYIAGISKFIQFKSAIRVELNIDWLRTEITLSRDGIKFTHEKLEQEFKGIIQRLISQFLKPKLDSLQKSKEKSGNKKLEQRIELAKSRTQIKSGIKGLSGGFTFRPETDGELAILLAQESVMKKINTGYKLIDYNDQAPFDCMIYDTNSREFIYTELEPTLIEFLEHKTKDNIQLVIIWSLGKWRVGSRKDGKGGSFELKSGSKKGYYKLLEYPNKSSKNPRYDYPIIALDEILIK